MAIKNRWYKTTQGVAYEFAAGKQWADVLITTFQEFVDNGAALDIALFYVDSIAAQPVRIPQGAALPAAAENKPVFLAFVETVTATPEAIIVSTTPMIGKTINAELVAYKAPSFQVASLLKSAGTFVAGQELTFKVIETTPANQPLPVWEYTEIITTEAATWTKIQDRINAANEGEFFTANDQATGIIITSTDSSRHFKLVAVVTPTKVAPDEQGVTFTYTVTTPASEGSGTLEQVLALQAEAQVRRGIGHFYPQAGTLPGEFGLPYDVVTAAATTEWDIVVLTGLKQEASPTYIGIHQMKHYIFAAVPAGLGQDLVDVFA